MKSIILSTAEVRAILDGRKTQARKVIKPQPVLDDDGFWQWNGDVQWKHGGLGCPQSAIDDYAPYKPGDILYVRETWSDFFNDLESGGSAYIYKAGEDRVSDEFRWDSSATMPREAARIFLEVKSVRVEQLHDISEEDAKAEGVDKACEGYSANKGLDGGKVDCIIQEYIFYHGFIRRWKWDNKRSYSENINPWVWVIEFERREKPE